MPYRFEKERKNYADYASGHVFYHAPGQPAFPVRLSSEIFQRCLAIRQEQGLTGPVTLYDPCCGGAYHLATLAYLHWHSIDTIIGSDIHPAILSIAARNLSLLTSQGIEQRAKEISTLFTQYQKPSHKAALESAGQFMYQLQTYRENHSLKTYLFVANALNSSEIFSELATQTIDVVMADVPYGQKSAWKNAPSASPEHNSLWFMLDALLPALSEQAVVAIVTTKSESCSHERYRRIERFQIGKRRIFLLQPRHASPSSHRK